MRIVTGHVVDGKVEVPPDAFPEGSEVAVVAAESDETFTLTADEVAELQESLEQIRRGEFVDGDELLKELRSQARP
jgi:Xaa-Pro aminopeptidase